MTRYIWDKKERRYKDRGFDYYFSLGALIFQGVVIYAVLVLVCLRYLGAGIALIVVWSLLYLWFWNLFKRDFP